MKRVFISADLRHYTCLEEMPFSMFVPKGLAYQDLVDGL
jgi:hypothetical protein